MPAWISIHSAALTLSPARSSLWLSDVLEVALGDEAVGDGDCGVLELACALGVLRRLLGRRMPCTVYSESCCCMGVASAASLSWSRSASSRASPSEEQADRDQQHRLGRSPAAGFDGLRSVGAVEDGALRDAPGVTKALSA